MRTNGVHNRASIALQYAMRNRLTTLGWSEVEVVDDDLGRSAAGGIQRAGFQGMVAQVCLGGWRRCRARGLALRPQQPELAALIEMCLVVDTVLIYQETVYALCHGNDRLLPGLKRSLNEYDLDLLMANSQTTLRPAS